MKLYTTIITLFVSSILFSTTLSAQDFGDFDEDIPVSLNNDGGGEYDLKGIVRNYIRAGRVVNRSIVKGKRIRTGENAPFEKIWLSVNASTTSFGIEFATPINDKFKIRVGGGFMPKIVSINKKIDVEDRALWTRLMGYYPIYDVDFKPNFFNGHALLSYYPVQNLGFHVTAGAYIGDHKFEAKGQLKNPATGENSQTNSGLWPRLEVEDYVLNIDNGKLDATLKVGSIIKPYLGVGYDWQLPESRWSFNFDLGVLYQGGLKVYQFGKEAPKKSEEVIYESDAININKYKRQVRFWPVLSVNIAYRIF